MIFLDSYVSENFEEEQSLFFTILYHDCRNGQIIQMVKRDEQVQQFSTCDINQLAYTGTDGNVYVSINTFKGKKRVASQVFNQTALFIDLDCHDSQSEEELERVKKRTIQVLEKTFDGGELLTPTMITETGRGFGLFYVLKNSIANMPPSFLPA